MPNPRTGFLLAEANFFPVMKVVCGAIIPALGTIIFNILGYYVETFVAQSGDQGLPYAIFDVAPGCAFAIVGVCVTLQDTRIMLKIMVALVFVILFTLGADMLYLIAKGYRLHFVIGADLLAFAGLSWAIAEAG